MIYAVHSEQFAAYLSLAAQRAWDRTYVPSGVYEPREE